MSAAGEVLVPDTPRAVTPPQLTAGELVEGWRAAQAFLRSRLLDVRSSAAASMPLRSDLEQVGPVAALISTET